ncbi:MAG: hypothetical protein HC810_02240 [Acaryochloridaceae cyanobacterium RL_2_7]|nr:hypothetical protein [Acaryochloridaceae cyanobacterium RL_2_7]
MKTIGREPTSEELYQAENNIQGKAVCYFRLSQLLEYAIAPKIAQTLYPDQFLTEEKLGLGSDFAENLKILDDRFQKSCYGAIGHSISELGDLESRLIYTMTRIEGLPKSL